MKRILVTRPRAQADSFVEGLRVARFEPIYFPVIEIRSVEDNSELDQALVQIKKYDWVVFTSVNGVEVVFDRLEKYSSLPRVAAIGPKTADALKARGVIPDFIPEEYVAEAILPGLGDLRGKWVLLPRAEIARKALPEAIIKAGGIAHEIAVYKTLAIQPDAEGLAALKAGVDVITLTSPSTVQNFVAIAKQNGFNPLNLPNNPLFACIGPITEQAAREEGLSNLVVAKEYTTEGLIQILSDLVNS
ncbi:MAG TPA: uroporphyrinogen-III synthase [Anaerolineales bacterium]|nr:uroporphyrinogen-III synthase [Anaerolineales bacterium]